MASGTERNMRSSFDVMMTSRGWTFAGVSAHLLSSPAYPAPPVGISTSSRWPSRTHTSGADEPT